MNASFVPIPLTSPVINLLASSFQCCAVGSLWSDGEFQWTFLMRVYQ